MAQVDLQCKREHSRLPRTIRLILGVLLILGFLPNFTRGGDDAKPWLEISSPHFKVITNGSEKQGRQVIEKFEEIRAVFHAAFPRMRPDTSVPILIFSTRDEQSFQALEPLGFKAKGYAKVGGFFIQGPEKNLVLVRLDLDVENLYDLAFHEYTHVILNQNVRALPLWLDEGVAEFYATARIRGKDVDLGRPSEHNVAILRENVALPLETLFQVDHASPYYKEQDKGTIFYAQSWALVHYMMIKPSQGGANPLLGYLELIEQGVDSVEAATRAFGDLGRLHHELEDYIHSHAFPYLQLRSSARLEDLALTARPLTPAESVAMRGDFLAHVRRYNEARTLLRQAMDQDGSNVQARESFGVIELTQNNLMEAAKWFSEAALLGSQNYLAHFYRAMLIEKEGFDEKHLAEAEASLKRSTGLNPYYAPALGALASVMTRQGNDLKGALGVAQRAMELDPGDQGYQLIAASLQVQLGEFESARQTAEQVIVNAKTPEDRAEAENVLMEIQKYRTHMQQQKEAEERASADEEAFEKRVEEASRDLDERQKREASEVIGKSAQEEGPLPPAKGKLGWSIGMITSVSCNNPPGLALTLRGSVKSLRLHAANYFKIGVEPKASHAPPDLDQCPQILGRNAAISYQPLEGSFYDGGIISLEIRK